MSAAAILEGPAGQASLDKLTIAAKCTLNMHKSFSIIQIFVSLGIYPTITSAHFVRYQTGKKGFNVFTYCSVTLFHRAFLFTLRFVMFPAAATRMLGLLSRLSEALLRIVCGEHSESIV